jgi:hypothetical protein
MLEGQPTGQREELRRTAVKFTADSLLFATCLNFLLTFRLTDNIHLTAAER